MVELHSKNIYWHIRNTAFQERWDALGCRGFTVWLTGFGSMHRFFVVVANVELNMLPGLSGSGKSTLASELEYCLIQKGLHAYCIDGGNIRLGMNSDLVLFF